MTGPRLRPTLLVLAALHGVACFSPRISDTGYVGTWARGGKDVRSTLSIWRRGDAYLVRWGVRSREGEWTVRCGWDGRCEETRGGRKTGQYTLRSWVDPQSRNLRVECIGRSADPDQPDVRYVDELRVEPGGEQLTAHTIEQLEARYAVGQGPKREFEKVSDEVVDPPRG